MYLLRYSYIYLKLLLLLLLLLVLLLLLLVLLFYIINNNLQYIVIKRCSLLLHIVLDTNKDG